MSSPANGQKAVHGAEIRPQTWFERLEISQFEKSCAAIRFNGGSAVVPRLLSEASEKFASRQTFRNAFMQVVCRQIPQQKLVYEQSTVQHLAIQIALVASVVSYRKNPIAARHRVQKI